MMSLGEEHPSKPIYIFALPAHLTDYHQNLWQTLLTSTTASHHPCRYIQHSPRMFTVTSIWYPPLNHWPPLRTYNVMWCLLFDKITCRLWRWNPDANSTRPHLCRECRCWSQPMHGRNNVDLAGDGRHDNTMERYSSEVAYLADCPVPEHQQQSRRQHRPMGSPNRFVCYRNQWSGVSKAALEKVPDRHNYPRWSDTLGATEWVCQGRPLPKEESDQWNPN